LHNGVKAPKLGLGCASGVRQAHVRSALEEGYRLLDTAQATKWGYSEGDVGNAVLESGLPREEVFIQTKIFPEDLGYQSTLRAFQNSLTNLKTTWVDSLLIHKPRCWGDVCKRAPEGTWQDSWRALEELYDQGVVKAIGICDVDHGMMDQLLKMRVKPHIIQNYMDPFHQDTAIRKRCAEEKIFYQAYSTLGTQWRARGFERNPVLEDRRLGDIAEAHQCTVAEVVLSWALGRGAAVIPASRSRERQRANLRSLQLQLSPEEVASIDALDGMLESMQTLTVRNDVTTPVEVFWVDGGQETKIDVIAPKGEKDQSTYHGHLFRFKSEGRVVMEHRVDLGAGRRFTVVVRSRGEL